MAGAVQVEKGHYDFSFYTDTGRWASYYYQISEAVASGCRDILYIGKGDGSVCVMLENILRFQGGGGNVVSFDFDRELEPDIVGDLLHIRDALGDKRYDCVLCCEVLEHIPFSQFECILRQLKEICRDTLVISLPDRMLHFRWGFAVPKIRVKGLFSVLRFWEKEIKFNGEHYWEVGTALYPKKKILKICWEYFIVAKQYEIFENPYHWFVILKAKKGN